MPNYHRDLNNELNSPNAIWVNVELLKTISNIPFQGNVRSNLAIHRLDTPFVIQQPIHRPRLLERVYKPVCIPH